jgi:Zn-dependent protease
MSNDKPKTGVWALIIKLGSKGLSILAKLFKISKVGFAAATFAGYSLLFSWKFALLFMIAVGFHESGHVWAMKKMGIKTKGFYFLPFVGGAAIAEEEYKSYGQNVFIAMMSPLWGAAMAYAAGGLYFMTGNPLWAAAAAWMATINLFNLLPINPLDGGQVIRSIAFTIHRGLGLVFLLVSMIAGIVIMFKLKIGLFALILIIGGLELFIEVWKRSLLRKLEAGLIRKSKLPESMLDAEGNVKKFPAKMNWKQLTLSAVSYVGTITILVVLLKLTAHIEGASVAANFLE